MDRPIHLWSYGHWGEPLLVFPSAAGMAHEWEAQGMVEALAEPIAQGHLKLYCTESNAAEAWTRKENHPAWRIQRHQVFERFVVRELVPFIRRDCQSEAIRLATSGCSLGAYYAANFTLKFPELFSYALCLSGRYDIRHFTEGFSNEDVYFNNPLAFVANLNGDALERLQDAVHLDLVCGQGKWEEGCIEETQAFGDLLATKGISHRKEIWGHDVSHDWDWWRRQAVFYLGQRFGA